MCLDLYHAMQKAHEYLRPAFESRWMDKGGLIFDFCMFYSARIKEEQDRLEMTEGSSPILS
jgi:hypothetical protein